MEGLQSDYACASSEYPFSGSAADRKHEGSEVSASSSNFAIRRLTHPDPDGAPEWKQELNERLAATRSRRTAREATSRAPAGNGARERKPETRAALLAARVAQRYANAPSYSELLAAGAGGAVPQWRAAGSTVAVASVSDSRHASGREVGVAAAGQEQPAASHRDSTGGSQSSGHSASRGELDSPFRESAQLFESGPGAAPPGDSGSEPAPNSGREPSPASGEDASNSTIQPLQANLIEFPRELVAARKARPRLVEGPLRESSEEAAHDRAQLRIFEVDLGSISTAVQIEPHADERAAIRLDEGASQESRERERTALQPPLKVAPLEDRLMAAIVDIALVFGSFALFVLVFAACTAHPPSGKPAALGAAAVLITFFALYQYLFFRYSHGTPGMRYAKIALCTFDDENPTREAALRRIGSLLLSAAPLGLGFAWAWFDSDRLGWHDRISGIYQRSYY